MADWIDNYAFPGVLDASDIAHLYDNGFISRHEALLKAFGITQAEYEEQLRVLKKEAVDAENADGKEVSDGELQQSGDLQRDDGEGPSVTG